MIPTPHPGAPDLGAATPPRPGERPDDFPGTDMPDRELPEAEEPDRDLPEIDLPDPEEDPYYDDEAPAEDLPLDRPDGPAEIPDITPNPGYRDQPVMRA